MFILIMVLISTAAVLALAGSFVLIWASLHSRTAEIGDDLLMILPLGILLLSIACIIVVRMS